MQVLSPQDPGVPYANGPEFKVPAFEPPGDVYPLLGDPGWYAEDGGERAGAASRRITKLEQRFFTCPLSGAKAQTGGLPHS